MLSKSLIVIIVGGAFVYFFFFRGGGGDPLPQNFKSESAKLIEENEVVGIDVRSIGEVRSNPAQGSIHMPLGEVESKLKELNLDKEKHYVVFCESGMRASMAIKQMKGLGFKKVSNIRDWRSWNKLKNK